VAVARHTAELELDCTEPSLAQVLHDAIAVEADEGPEGSHVTLRVDGATLHARVEAEDVSGLRAAIHSVLRLLDAARRTVG
jgi:tRNA threonylcarbamoyladenosine modification (KEOPS) complex  Pcc1 subunit